MKLVRNDVDVLYNSFSFPAGTEVCYNGPFVKGETYVQTAKVDTLPASTNTKVVQDTGCTIQLTSCWPAICALPATYNEGDYMNIVALVSDADSDNFVPSVSGAIPNGVATTSTNRANFNGVIAGDGSGIYSNIITAGVPGAGGCSATVNYTVNNALPPF